MNTTNDRIVTDYAGNKYRVNSQNAWHGAFVVVETTRRVRNEVIPFASRDELIDYAHRCSKCSGNMFMRYTREEWADVWGADERAEKLAEFDAAAENGKAVDVNGELTAPSQADEYRWACDVLFGDAQSARFITEPGDIENDDYSHVMSALCRIGACELIEETDK